MDVMRRMPDDDLRLAAHVLPLQHLLHALSRVSLVKRRDCKNYRTQFKIVIKIF